MVLWDEVFRRVAADYPDVETESVLVDAMAAKFVLRPEELSVMVASNLFADILSDLGPACTGTIGIAPSGNINPEGTFPSLFEPVHGSAPDIAGQGVANPIGVFVEPDPGGPTRYVPFLVQSGISLPDESYYRLENFAGTRERFREHVEKLLDLAGIPEASGQADRVVALETDIASHHWDNVRSRDAVATYNLKT